MPNNAPRSRTPGVVAYAVATYLIFLAVLVYSVGFFAGVGVPKAVDSGPRGSAGVAVALDLSLLALFAVQHSVMARPAFKRVWLRVVPVAAERTSYVLAASLLLALVYRLWRPLGGVVWEVHGLGEVVLRFSYVVGWALVIGSTYLISHTDLFGLRQAWQQRRYRPPQFTERSLYRLVRHPLMLGFVVVFWSAPTMTAGHLLFAVASTGYIVVGTALEERDLVRDLGATYLDYRARVRAVVPLPRRAQRDRSLPSAPDARLVRGGRGSDLPVAHSTSSAQLP